MACSVKPGARLTAQLASLICKQSIARARLTRSRLADHMYNARPFVITNDCAISIAAYCVRKSFVLELSRRSLFLIVTVDVIVTPLL